MIDGVVRPSLVLLSGSEPLDAAASSSVHLTEKVRVMRTVLRGRSARVPSSIAEVCRGVSMYESLAVKDDDKPLGRRTVEPFDCEAPN